MSQSFLDRAQTVGYRFDEKLLVVTLTEKMANKMKADGWDIKHEDEIGYFVTVQME
jgi:hypothetical protein